MHESAAIRRPRLLLIGPYFRPKYYGGVVQVYHQLLTRLQALDGIIVSQRLGADSLGMAAFDRDCPSKFGYRVLRVARFDLTFQSDAGLWERLFDSARFFIHTKYEWMRVLQEVEPDIIVCGATLTAGWLMSHVPRSIPFVNYLHGEELATVGGSRFVRPYLFRKQLEAIREADLNISVSRYTASRAADLSGIDRDDIQLLPNFVDITRFSPPAEREALRQRLGWHDKRIILTLSRLTPRKGIDQAIRALAVLRREGRLSPDWLHVIAGQGEQEQQLRALVGELGITEHTKFEGFVDDDRVPEYYGAADVFLQPNRDLCGDTEGFGVVFLEANACGTPVIGGNAGGTADAIRDGITGLRVDGEDLSAIAGAVEILTGHEESRRRMGLAGVEIIRREHRVEVAVERFEELLLGVLRKRRSLQSFPGALKRSLL
jgi:phosphatidylinositol alpha-1,6-mannosyltransferase